MSATKLERLTMIGFVPVGRWRVNGDAIAIALDRHAKARNVLYAFVVDGDVAYVGKTIRTLAQRMQNYRTPSPSQRTSFSKRREIRYALARGATVEVYALPDNGLMHYGGFHINLAAGLEDDIIRGLTPPWNGGKKEDGASGATVPIDPPAGDD